MKYSSDKINQTVATEKYRPILSDEYTNQFQLLIKRLQSTLQINRIRIIQEEISKALRERNESNEIESNRYIASLSVLVDLSQQGWIFDIQDGELTLKMENNNVDEKEKIRYRLSAERNAQFKSESVAKFIRYMETERPFENHIISITCLIGDKDILINTIRNNQTICEPYIQLVTNERDEYTGYKLSDIWRYFRYTWSIPYKTMPGRNLYYLVRDRLQPYVRCGLVGPKGNRATIKRYLINSFTLETITLSALNCEAIKDGIEFRSLSERLIDAYNILIGADAENEYSVLENCNVAQATPGDLRGDLSTNAQALANTYISLGLGKRYADGVTLIGWRL